ncbi:DUF222 domain-containing protein [Mycobacteroides immunogenum]|uniref:HNH endonuclease signature motif containing protein n=1 Tax=Mycobacteroides immunogenum TaxID=83262 RepID=UPI0025B74E60|nr:HNH endonuclease signature motif containing protein [Mycobacteroides immunogenum]WJR33764.1 DUF222 domain-containing protein [Mycobacteroides immunogenum]
MFDSLTDGDLIEVITAAHRAEAQACARRLGAIGVLVDRYADLDKPDERDHHPLDRWDRVAAEIAAAQGITQALASIQMRYAEVLRHRLRAVAERFAAVHARSRRLTDSVTNGYRPSSGLAAFVRARDQLCRFPGCDAAADRTDLDHTVPWGASGPTTGNNLKALCRKHHLLKTFGGWCEIQEPDGTVIWKAPTGHTYTTSPGGGLLFPTLARQRTRKQERQNRRQHERNLNHQNRLQREAALATIAAKDPPPF